MYVYPHMVAHIWETTRVSSWLFLEMGDENDGLGVKLSKNEQKRERERERESEGCREVKMTVREKEKGSKNGERRRQGTMQIRGMRKESRRMQVETI